MSRRGRPVTDLLQLLAPPCEDDKAWALTNSHSSAPGASRMFKLACAMIVVRTEHPTPRCTSRTARSPLAFGVGIYVWNLVRAMISRSRWWRDFRKCPYRRKREHTDCF